MTPKKPDDVSPRDVRGLKALVNACGGYQQGDNGMTVNRTPYRSLCALVDALPADTEKASQAFVERIAADARRAAIEEAAKWFEQAGYSVTSEVRREAVPRLRELATTPPKESP